MAKVSGTIASVVTWAIRLTFLLIFTAWTLIPYTLALLTDLPLFCVRPRTTEEIRSRQRWMSYIAGSCWKIALSMCFWIRRDTAGLAPLQDAGLSSRGVYLCVNHVSFFDIPLVCCSLPWRLVPEVKAVMVRWLLRAPVLGRIADAVGHLPLPFVSGRGSTNHGMDASLLESCMKRIDDHVGAGGSLAVFPEGNLNPDWRTLKLFRGGGFEIAIRHDMEVWGLVMVGVADAWQTHLVLGGDPAKVTFKAIPIATSAREFGERLAGPGSSLKEQGIAMANHAQTIMQESLNEVCAARQAA